MFSQRRCLFLLLVLSVFALAKAQQMHRYDTGFTVSQRFFCDTIPLEFTDNQLLLTVEIDGVRRKALLDTGASQGVVFLHRLPKGTRELGNVVAYDGNGQHDTIPVVQLPAFRLGSLTIDGYVAAVHRNMPVRMKYDMILGFDLFNKGIAGKIDTKSNQLILSDKKGAFLQEGGYRQKYKLKWFVPYTIISPFKRHADEVSFDTGYRGFYTMNKNSFDRHVYKSKQVEAQVEARTEGQRQISLLGVEAKTEVAFLRLDRLQFGEFEFTQVKAVTNSGPSKMGAEILQYGSMLILPHKKLLVFQPYAVGRSLPLNNEIRQIAFVPSSGQAMVGLVNPASDAYKKGVRSGDVLLQINHQTVNTFEAFLNYPFVKGKEYLFTFRSVEGNVKQILLPR